MIKCVVIGFQFPRVTVSTLWQQTCHMKSHIFPSVGLPLFYLTLGISIHRPRQHFTFRYSLLRQQRKSTFKGSCSYEITILNKILQNVLFWECPLVFFILLSRIDCKLSCLFDKTHSLQRWLNFGSKFHLNYKHLNIAVSNFIMPLY